MLIDELIEHILDGPGLECSLKEACLLCMIGEMPQDAFYQIIRYLGNRVYNCFLDYGALLLRLTRFLTTSDLVIYDSAMWDRLHRIFYYLMLDDRHDLYQNLPGKLEEFGTTDELQYWNRLCHILVSCINESGTYDTCVEVW